MFTPYPDDFFLSNGVSKQEIDEIRECIKTLQNMTEEKIQRVYGKTREEVKLLKLALSKNDNYSFKSLTGNTVSTSGSIANSKLYTSLYVANRSSSSAPNYRVQFYFKWSSSPFYIGGWDEMGFAWGGNLKTKEIRREFTRPAVYEPNYWPYYPYFYEGTGYGYDHTNTMVNEIKQSVGCGLLNRFKLSPVFNQLQGVAVESGYTYFTLFQNQFQNYSTKILARYGHKVPSVGVSSMSFTSAPDLKLGWGFDYTEELSANITY